MADLVNKKEREFREYKEERFEFAIFVNENMICKRNFRIFNYIEDSMNTVDFKQELDMIVHMIDTELKSKSRVYTWYYFNPDDQDENDEFHKPLLEPFECTFKIVIYDKKREVISKIWDGYGYPKAIRDSVDFVNKNVKIKTRDGQTYVYDKESFFKQNEGRLLFEHEVLKAMIMDKGDLLLKITKKICNACSPSPAEIEEKESDGKFDPRDSGKYLSRYTQVERHGKGKDARDYPYSLYLTNRAKVRAWDKATAEKTKQYFRTL